jgi:transcriptional regulator with XRE-family HTH domain
MAAPKPDVSPDVLVWARESIGFPLEEAARRLGMSALELRFMEEGVGSPSLPKLRDMARIYDRPLIVNFLPEPPELEDSLPDFRTTPQTRGASWSPQLHSAYRRVVSQRQAVIELAELNDDEPMPVISITLGPEDDPEEAGSLLRSWLGAPDEFGDAEDSREMFNEWTALVEARGVIVAQVSGVDVTEMRGFSIAERPYPAIAINNKDAYSARSLIFMIDPIDSITEIRDAKKPGAAGVAAAQNPLPGFVQAGDGHYRVLSSDPVGSFSRPRER